MEKTRRKRNSQRHRQPHEDTAVIRSQRMNERQQAHIDYFLERIAHWKAKNRDETTARMLAARDADHAHPMRNEEEATEAFDYLRRLEREQSAGRK